MNRISGLAERIRVREADRSDAPRGNTSLATTCKSWLSKAFLIRSCISAVVSSCGSNIATRFAWGNNLVRPMAVKVARTCADGIVKIRYFDLSICAAADELEVKKMALFGSVNCKTIGAR